MLFSIALRARRNGWPIWGPLIALGLGIAVPVVLFCGFLIWNFERSEEARYQAQVATYAEQAAAAVDRELKDRVSVLRALANSPLLETEDLRSFYDEARGLARFVDADVVLFDPVSRAQLLDTRVPFGSKLTGTLPARALRALDPGSQSLILDGRIDEFADDDSVIIYLQSTRAGAAATVVAMLFDRKRLSEVLKQDVSSPDWTSAIIDEDGVILARSNAAARFVKTNAPPDLRIAPPRGEVKIARIRNLDGTRALAGFARSNLAAWTVAVTIPSDVIEAPLLRSWMLFAIAGSLFVALSGVIALRIGSYITRPVLGLARAATEVGRGETVRPVLSGLREIDLASEALSRASVERKKSEEQVALLMRELAHRNKNVLTMVQAIAHRAARHAKSVADFEHDFYARLAALAGSSDRLLSRNWTSTDLAALVRSQLSPFPQLDRGQIRLAGPPIRLGPRAAEGLGLAFHELATNALKHGALSVPAGFVTIEWALSRTSVSLVWTEHGGPPVRQPSVNGFGRAVIERMVPQLLMARASLEFRQEGLRWSLDVPRESVEEGATDSQTTPAKSAMA